MISQAHKDLMKKSNQTYAEATKDWTPRQHWLNKMRAEQNVAHNEERIRNERGQRCSKSGAEIGKRAIILYPNPQGS